MYDYYDYFISSIAEMLLTNVTNFVYEIYFPIPDFARLSGCMYVEWRKQYCLVVGVSFRGYATKIFLTGFQAYSLSLSTYNFLYIHITGA